MKKIIYKIWLPFLLFFGGALSAQPDNHIDPSPYKTTYRLSFTKHINTSMSQSDVDVMLIFGNAKLQTCDNRVSDSQDVACQVQFERNGALTTFGTASNGLDSIDDVIDILTKESEIDQVHKLPQFVKIVTALVSGGNISNGIVSAI